MSSDGYIGLSFRGRALMIARVVLVAIAIAVSAGTVTVAEEAAVKIGLELNRVEKVGEGCRLSFVFRNGLPGTIEAMALEMVVSCRPEAIDVCSRAGFVLAN